MSLLQKRIEALEQRTGHTADSFAECLNADDAKFYTAIMRRWAKSRQEFETFVRRMEQGELERLLQMHLNALGMSREQVERLADGAHRSDGAAAVFNSGG